LAVVHAARGDDEDLLPRQRRLVALHHLDGCGDEDRGRHVAGVAAALAALCADHVDAEVEAFLDVLGVPDHVHVEDAGFVQFLDNGFGRDADGADEELGARVDDDVDELVQLALCVVVAGARVSGAPGSGQRLDKDLLGLASASADLGKQQIDTEWCALVVEVALELGNLLAEHVWGVSNAAEDTDASGVCDGSGKLGTSGHVHAGKHDGVLDLEQISELCADLLCGLSALR
jgi:hypothetical protein